MPRIAERGDEQPQLSLLNGPLRWTLRRPPVSLTRLFMAKRRNNAQRLRNAVYAMPRRTKEAMLRGIRSNRVIVGAYVDKRGGVCPMLAAHRNGGRTNFGTFARAWDAYTGANATKPRRASRREVARPRGLPRAVPDPRRSARRRAEPGAPLTEEVREVQATRRRLAEADAREGSDVTVEDVLTHRLRRAPSTPPRTPPRARPAELERAAPPSAPTR